MIVYNNRYRGPLEYDKFALNILTFHNLINEIMNNEMTTSMQTNILFVQDALNELIENYYGHNKISEHIHQMIINHEGEKTA